MIAWREGIPVGLQGGGGGAEAGFLPRTDMTASGGGGVVGGGPRPKSRQRRPDRAPTLALAIP